MSYYDRVSLPTDRPFLLRESSQQHLSGKDTIEDKQTWDDLSTQLFNYLQITTYPLVIFIHDFSSDELLVLEQNVIRMYEDVQLLMCQFGRG